MVLEVKRNGFGSGGHLMAVSKPPERDLRHPAVTINTQTSSLGSTSFPRRVCRQPGLAIFGVVTWGSKDYSIGVTAGW